MEIGCSRDDKVKTVELFDEYWFFKNLLNGRTMVCRCSSDLSPSSNISPQTFIKNPDGERSLSMYSFARCNLLRTPSLPPCIRREEVAQDEESDPELRKVTLQGSNPSDVFSPSRHTSKSMIETPNNPKRRARRESESSTDKYSKSHLCLSKETSRRCLSHLKSRKSLSDLECEEVQGFRDMGFIFDKEDLNPSVVNIIPGLQDKARLDGDEEKVMRPYLSEAWLVQSAAPPIPYWVDSNSVRHLKAKLKFWARAVASNMHQEC